MVHTYRDPNVRGRRQPSWSRALFEASTFPLLGGGLVLVLGSWLGKPGFTWGERAQILVGVALTAGVFALVRWRYSQQVCSEIRLDDDAKTCEFETTRGVKALHVRQITAVAYDNDGDSPCDYHVRYRGGNIPVEAGMSEFPDFLMRVSALNPGIDLSSIPSRIWHQ